MLPTAVPKGISKALAPSNTHTSQRPRTITGWTRGVTGLAKMAELTGAAKRAGLTGAAPVPASEMPPVLACAWAPSPKVTGWFILQAPQARPALRAAPCH